MASLVTSILHLSPTSLAHTGGTTRAHGCRNSAATICRALRGSSLGRPSQGVKSSSSSRSRLSAIKGLGVGQSLQLKACPLSPPSPHTALSSSPFTPFPAPPHRRPSHVTCAGRGGGEDTVDAGQRVLASVGYLLPFLDGAKYGRYLYLQYPLVRTLLDPIVPAIQLYNGLPFAGFIAFFALYLGVIQNQGMPRYVRYNVMQAVILDILMILPALLERVFTFRDGVGFQITIVCYNTVFLYLVACVLFGAGSCLLGKNPRLPLVADAAEAQVPF